VQIELRGVARIRGLPALSLLNVQVLPPAATTHALATTRAEPAALSLAASRAASSAAAASAATVSWPFDAAAAAATAAANASARAAPTALSAGPVCR